VTDPVKGRGTPDDPWVLRTPSGAAELLAHRDEGADPPELVIVTGGARVPYHLRCIEDLHAMLVERGDWIPLGSADEGKPVREGTDEAWARADDNPVGGYYGLRKGLRGRFANHVPPVLEALGLVELEHAARSNRVRAAG